MIWKYCPRCDRAFMGSTEELALKAVSSHMDEAHPEMQNEVREVLDEMEEAKKNGGTV